MAEITYLITQPYLGHRTDSMDQHFFFLGNGHVIKKSNLRYQRSPKSLAA